MRNKTILSFFFNARGEELEKSTVGMYRSLLLQMLQQLPRLHTVLEPGLILGISENHDWGVEALRTLFEQAVEGLGDSSVVVFIDALDECDESEIRSMVSSFKFLGNVSAAEGVSFQVCLASRHYPHITMPRKIELVLERQEGHEQDITSYLDSELEIGESKLANEIRAQIKEKASGVFMWVVLVTGILQQKYDQGRIHDLKQTLREIPGDLHKLFRNILTRDDANKDELLLCIQWVLFARNPLKPEQLYFAIRSHTECTTCKWDRDEIGETAIGNFVLSSSKGLAEVPRVKQNPSVQFIHESVRDFLLKDNGLRVVLMEEAGNIGAESHDQLKRCCFEYTQSYLAEHGVPAHDSKAHLTQARTTADSEFPFLRYAVQNVLYHANAADDGNISQASFLGTFPREEWILYNNFFQDKEVRRHTSEASLLYLLAECNFASLIQGHRGSQSCFDIEWERYGAPILAAMATGSRPAVRSLLKREIRDEPGESLLRDLCDEYRVKVEMKFCLGRDFKYNPKWSLLYYVLQDQDLAVASFAIASPKAYTNTNFRTPRGETSFLVAFRQVYDFCDAVKLLVGNGADIKISDMLDKTPLSLAAEKGNVAAVAFLLVNKANVDAKAYGGKPLVCATRGGNQKCMEQLISAGANVAVVDHRGQTLLFRATESSSAQEAKIRLLIARNLDVQAVDNNGYTALTWSLMQGTVTAETARILLYHEDTIDRTDSLGRTILSYAAEYGKYLYTRILDFRKPDFIRLLLDKGADVNRADTSDRSPLSYAASCIDSQAADCVQLLLERGANPNIVDKNGNTALSYASVRAYATRGAVRDLLLKFLNPV
ncbi:ankyrin 3 [Fusarium phyllophilum]|uniref:Ankyrin 3 n=1 Tax=Fusarium phyllophilum TaxID=47803 RepID=A0A8H5JT86_9HYPO|nr:ankyrin 3 [Fusarium phyllophilum]